MGSPQYVLLLCLYIAYKEALITGLRIVKNISKERRDEHYSRFYFEFGWVLMDMGFSKKAVEYYEKALAIDREVYGEKHPSVATDLNNLGSAWDSLGDSKKAVEYYEKAHQIFHEILGPDHPYTISAKKALHYLKDSLSSHQE